MDLSNFWWQSGGKAGAVIGNSLRFRGAQRLSGSISSGNTQTASFWMKWAIQNDNHYAFAHGGNFAFRSHAGALQQEWQVLIDPSNVDHSMVWRDPSAWYHVVISTTGSQTNWYVNGTLLASGGGASASSSPFEIGARSNAEFFDGYLAEFHYVEGTALDPTSFGEFNADGVWVPKKVSGLTYGTNGFYLAFDDVTQIGKDSSGNNNHFTPTGFDLTNGGPGANYAAFGDNTTCEPGSTWDKTFDGSTGQTDGANPPATNGASTKWELPAGMEVPFTKLDIVYAKQSNSQSFLTINGTNIPTTNFANDFVVRQLDVTSMVTSPLKSIVNHKQFPAGQLNNGMWVIQILVNGKPLKNYTGTYDWVADSPTDNYATINPLYPGASTSNANLTTANTTGKPTIIGLAGNGWDGTEAGWTQKGDVDFGQRFLPGKISTSHLPDVPIKNPSDHFTTILDTGANILTKAQAKFPNGLWWIKDRANNNQHQLVDSVRGGNLALTCPNMTTQQAYTAPAGNSVAWCWKAGGAPAANTNGTIASQVSVNPAGGFSIVTYTGTQHNGTVGHGLSQAPELIFIKAVTKSSQHWMKVYHRSIPITQYINLNDSYGAANDPGGQIWNGIAPTNTTFSLGIEPSVNETGINYVAYAWHSVPGYSAFGSYRGNGSEDGPFIYTNGFRPAFVLIKHIDGGGSNWHICDTQRQPYNANTCHWLLPSTVAPETVASQTKIDILSNGFKVRSPGNAEVNASGGNYIYAAFAEHPFGGGNVSPSPAR